MFKRSTAGRERRRGGAGGGEESEGVSRAFARTRTTRVLWTLRGILSVRRVLSAGEHSPRSRTPRFRPTLAIPLLPHAHARACLRARLYVGTQSRRLTGRVRLYVRLAFRLLQAAQQSWSWAGSKRGVFRDCVGRV